MKTLLGVSIGLAIYLLSLLAAMCLTRWMKSRGLDKWSL